MINVPLNSVHLFRKENVVSMEDNISQYDIMKCSSCGLTGKCRNMITVEVDGRKKRKAENCNKSQKQLKQEEISQEYEFAKVTEINCPECNKFLRSTADWTEEGKTGITHKSVICSCGYKEIIDVT